MLFHFTANQMSANLVGYIIINGIRECGYRFFILLHLDLKGHVAYCIEEQKKGTLSRVIEPYIENFKARVSSIYRTSA